MTDLPRLSQETLEDLLIAMSWAKDYRGLHICLRPEDVFSQEILEQLPDVILGGPGPNNDVGGLHGLH